MLFYVTRCGQISDEHSGYAYGLGDMDGDLGNRERIGAEVHDPCMVGAEAGGSHPSDHEGLNRDVAGLANRSSGRNHIRPNK